MGDTGGFGFSSLSGALRDALTGRLNVDLIENYLELLTDRLEASKEAFRNLRVPPEIANQVSPRLNQTELLFERLDTVLDLVEDFLEDKTEDSLEEALSLLQRVQNDMGSRN